MNDLFQMALRNGPALQKAFESAMEGLPEARVAWMREFAAWVEAEGLICINADLLVAVELVQDGRYQNVSCWAVEQARLSGRPAEDHRKERLGKWYNKRVAFESAFDRGEELQYGAITAGGAGLSKYGTCCLVLSRAFQDSLKTLAYLPGDSLFVCFAADGSLDLKVTECLACPHSHRHFLVAKDLKAQVLTSQKADWPGLLFPGGRYFEALFIGDISLAALHCVRMSKADYDRKWSIAFGSVGRKPDEAERALLQDFIQLRRAELDGKIRVEVVT